MPRAVRIDIGAPEVLETVDILPSPPPAYTQLPPAEPAPEASHAAQDFLSDTGSDDSWDEEDGQIIDEDEEDDDAYGNIDAELVNEQDWENAATGHDLSKRYNRLRQHVNALTGEKRTSGNGQSQSTPLPAQNQHHQRQQTRQKEVASSISASIGTHTSKLDSSLSALSHKYASALNLAPVASTSSAFNAQSSFAEPSFTSNAATRKGGSERRDVTKDKSDRATNEQVLDPRTRLVLFKMLGRGLLEKVEGCVSTGKEANVYHALGRLHPDAEPPSEVIDLAIKIYKTSILTFKSRSKYLTGEFRFKNGYSKVKNPRKMVRLWAEKEMRNLKRLHTAGIPCPEPVEVRGNVLVMTFLGKEHGEGWEACPRLKDAELPADKLEDLYLEMLWIVRRLFKVCKLVHADLSEYNLLYNTNDGHLYTIDVSQSVEGDHPHAFDFLRSDIGNVDEFFGRRGVATLGMKRTFDLTIEAWGKNGEETFDELKEEVSRRFALPEVEEQEEADKVFKQSYIPRTLNEVYDPERDVQRVLQGEKDQLIYSNVAGISVKEPGDNSEDGESDGSDDGTGSESGSGEEHSDEDGEDDRQTKSTRKRDEDKDAKRERKQAVKEEKREKRKDKIPKAVKKAKVKKTSGKRK